MVSRHPRQILSSYARLLFNQESNGVTVGQCFIRSRVLVHAMQNYSGAISVYIERNIEISALSRPQMELGHQAEADLEDGLLDDLRVDSSHTVGRLAANGGHEGHVHQPAVSSSYQKFCSSLTRCCCIGLMASIGQRPFGAPFRLFGEVKKQVLNLEWDQIASCQGPN